MRRTLLAYTMCDTIYTLILDPPPNNGARACEYLEEGGENFHTGSSDRGSAKFSGLVAVSLWPDDYSEVTGQVSAWAHVMGVSCSWVGEWRLGALVAPEPSNMTLP